METVHPTVTFHVSASTEAAYQRWKASQPYTDEMIGLVRVVREVVEAGAYYSTDVCQQVCARYAFTEEELARGKGAVEGGVVGMDIYYAREAMDRENHVTREEDAKRRLHLEVGKRLGAVMFHYTMFRNVEVVEAATQVTVLGTRGNRRYQIRTSYQNVLRGIEDAQRRTRKEQRLCGTA